MDHNKLNLHAPCIIALAKLSGPALCTAMPDRESLVGRWEDILAEARDLERRISRIEVALGPEPLLQPTNPNPEVLDKAAHNIGSVR